MRFANGPSVSIACLTKPARFGPLVELRILSLPPGRPSDPVRRPQENPIFSLSDVGRRRTMDRERQSGFRLHLVGEFPRFGRKPDEAIIVKRDRRNVGHLVGGR